MNAAGRRTRMIDGGARLLCGVTAWLLAGLLPLFAVVLALRANAAGLPWTELAGALGASALLAGLAVLLAAPFGLGAAIWLEDYLRSARLRALFEANLAALEAAPPFAFGLLVVGLGVGAGAWAGVLAIACAVVVGLTSSCRAALVEVSLSEREAGLALGGTRGRIIFHVVLPVAGRALGAALVSAFARGVGLTAPLILIFALVDAPVQTGMPLSVALFEGLSTSLPGAAGAALLLGLLSVGLDLLAAALWGREARA